MENENNEKKQEKKPGRKRVLPSLSSEASEAFDSFVRLSAADRTAFIANATEQMRADGVTESRALREAAESDETSMIAVGDRVRVVSGDPKHMGAVGIVARVSRVRAFVTVPGSKRPVYAFLSDLEPISSVEDEDADLSSEEGLEETG